MSEALNMLKSELYDYFYAYVGWQHNDANWYELRDILSKSSVELTNETVASIIIEVCTAVSNSYEEGRG